ncbi:hypothetical protein ARALYDRAFT_889846 [Arabidopsis lyrata subsp. lyrata]|uniref:Uncharacterized protein n=1 Tax=Arabidopsis lyrata subsp. lyrata TaxID=81972 RepID=D7KMQ2_ARALL|nr:hypothetical protein ARALYDRAFT_889846 [Arabidopsis lyrata subsp. lyrata]
MDSLACPPDRPWLGLVLVGKATTDGTFNVRAKATVTKKVKLKANATLSTALVSLEYMGLSSRTQLQFGTNDLGGATYIQVLFLHAFNSSYIHHSEIVYFVPPRASPHLSLGCEFVCASLSQKSAVGYAVRYEDEKMLLYKLIHGFSSHGVSLQLLCDYNFEQITLPFFLLMELKQFFEIYLFLILLRLLFQYRVRENVDSDGVACGLVESGMRTGKIILSAKMADLKKRDVVFGLGDL